MIDSDLEVIKQLQCMIKIESDSNMAEGVSNLFTGMSRSAMYRSVKLIRDLQLSSPKWDKIVCVWVNEMLMRWWLMYCMIV